MALLLAAPMPRYKSVDEAAELAGLGRRTIWRWISNGQLQAFRIAGDKRRFVDLDELDKLRQPQPITGGRISKGGRQKAKG